MIPTDWVILRPPLAVFLTWIVLWDHRSKATGICWPSTKRIRKLTGLSRASVKRAAKWLLDHGYVERIARPQGRVAYRLLWSKATYPARYAEALMGVSSVRQEGLTSETVPGLMDETQKHSVLKQTACPKGHALPERRFAPAGQGVLETSIP